MPGFSRPGSTTPREPSDVVTIENGQGGLVQQNDNASHVPATSGAATLLPRPVASLVSFVTQSTSLSLRVGTFFGGVALDGARATTLTGLELSRAVIEGVLTRAGRDVSVRSGGDRGKTEAESLLERSVSYLNSLFSLGFEELIYIAASCAAYNGDVCVILCGCIVPFLVDDVIIRFSYVPGSIINPRCHSWFHRILEGHSSHHHAHSKRIQGRRAEF